MLTLGLSHEFEFSLARSLLDGGEEEAWLMHSLYLEASARSRFGSVMRALCSPIVLMIGFDCIEYDSSGSEPPSSSKKRSLLELGSSLRNRLSNGEESGCGNEIAVQRIHAE